MLRLENILGDLKRMDREELINYLLNNSPFSYGECEDIADKIDGTESLAYIHEVLLGYIGGEDDYAYETMWELAEEIKRL